MKTARLLAFLVCLAPNGAHAQGRVESVYTKVILSECGQELSAPNVEMESARYWCRGYHDLEVMVKLYDITGRSRQLLSSFEQFTDQRGQRTIISEITLERKTIGVNKEIQIELDYRGKILATGRFKILGEAERYSGKVDFSDEDTQGKDEEE